MGADASRPGRIVRRLGRALAHLALLAAWSLPAPAHETIDAEKATALLNAAERADASVRTATAPDAEGEARFALGFVLVEATESLNRDLAAHNGHLEFNAERLQKALAQRDLAPRFDEAIGRYRVPRAPLEQALRLLPAAPSAVRARFELLKAGFYESFVLDPFELVGIKFDNLQRQIAEAEALAPALPNSDDAEEASFIDAIDLARAARLAPRPVDGRAYASRAKAALAAFAATHAESMRAAAAGMLLKRLDGAD